VMDCLALEQRPTKMFFHDDAMLCTLLTIDVNETITTLAKRSSGRRSALLANREQLTVSTSLIVVRFT